MISFHTIDHNEFSIFIRNLSENMNTNINHLIDDKDKSNKEQLKHKCKKNKKKSNFKTRDEIIESQNKIRYIKNINDDTTKIESFDMNDKFPYKNFKILITDEMKEIYCINLLEYHWNMDNKDMEMIIGLYYQYNKTSIPKHKLLINKIKSKLDNYEYKNYILKNLGHILPPLNFWNYEKKLDDWQLEAIDHVKNNKSLFIRAPTSSGKSFIGLSCALYHKKILYVCPAEPVVYQVGSQFQKLNYKVHYLVEDIYMNSYDEKCNIFVGTPEYIEEYLYKIGVNFDYAVFDEIHTINNKYENIIKLLPCNFLALSATVSNINNIIDVFKNIYSIDNINLIEYNRRFINIQRWVWTDKLEKVHPLTCIKFEDLNTDFIKNNLSFTPNDLSNLWEKIEEIYHNEDISDYINTLSPDNYFDDDNIITLDNIHDYELHLKKALIELSITYPIETKTLLDHYNQDYSIKEKDLIQCFKKCKKKDMFPMLLFTSDDNECINIFNDINTNIELLESINFPYYYDILEKKQELYLSYNNRLINFSSNIKLKNSTNSLFDKSESIDKFNKTELDKYTTSIINYYNSLIIKIEKSTNKDKIKNIQINNLNRELSTFIKHPDLIYQDIFKKHKDYCFTIVPMDSIRIKNIRRKINKSLGILIPYEHAIFQMLKRGIGLYHKSMPKDYKWIIQNLLANRELSIVISDRELCLGIDLPIRTTCLVGVNDTSFSTSDYLQMSGRAGRRGHDNQGNILFYNLNFKSIMKGTIPSIIGSTIPIYSHYDILSKLNSKIDSSSVYNNMINDKRTIIHTTSLNNHRIGWILRNYKNPNILVDYIDNYCIGYINTDEINIINIFSELLSDISIVVCFIQNEYHKLYKTLIDLIVNIYNSITKEHPIKPLLINIFDKLKRLYIKYNNFIL
mgnify:CR=1 FL=1